MGLQLPPVPPGGSTSVSFVWNWAHARTHAGTRAKAIGWNRFGTTGRSYRLVLWGNVHPLGLNFPKIWGSNSSRWSAPCEHVHFLGLKIKVHGPYRAAELRSSTV